MVGRASARTAARGARSATAKRVGRPRRADQLPVEDEVMIVVGELGRPLRSAIEQLADREPAGIRVDERPEPPEQFGELGLVAVELVDLAGRTPSGRHATGFDGRSGSLRNTLKTSRRKPSTPRSSQSRTIASWPPRPPGCASSGRAARAGTCAGRTGRGADPTSRPTRRRTTPSCSAAAASRRPRRRPGRATGTSRRRGCRATTGSPRTRRADRWCGSGRGRGSPAARAGGASATRRSKSASVPNTGSTPPWSADVVADIEPRRGVDRREPHRRRRRGPLEVVEVIDDPGQIADAVAVAVGEAPRVDLVDDGVAPPVGRGGQFVRGRPRDDTRLGHASWAPSAMAGEGTRLRRKG